MTVADSATIHSHPGAVVIVFSDESFSVSLEALCPGISVSTT